jgi:signal transduction histidine kinase
VTRVIDAVRALGLVVVLITVSVEHPGPTTPGARGAAIAAMLGLCAAAWIAWMLAGRRAWLTVGSLVVMGAAGGALTGLSQNSPAVGVACVAAFSAGAQLSSAVSLGIVAETVAAFLISALVIGASTGLLLGYSWAVVGLWTIALTRREFLVRAEQAEHTLAETRRAREAETQAAALAERARIARDIHDVLAHSLAAVSVNLQAAEGLLTAGTLATDPGRRCTRDDLMRIEPPDIGSSQVFSAAATADNDQ